MNRRTIWAWCFYDFGNSSFAVLFPAIYGAYYVEHVGAGTTWWAAVGSVSMACVALSAPLLGGVADHSGVRKRMLAIYTVLGIGAVLVLTLVGKGMILTGFLVGVVANFAFEGGIVFYNSYLPDIAPPTHHGRISARGFAVGYVGSLLALAVAAPLANAGLIEWIWVALAVQWTVAVLPAFTILPRDEPTGLGVVAAARRGLEMTLATWKEVLDMRDLRRFLLAYFFYMDGVTTVIFFAGTYAKEELGFSDGALIGMLALVQVCALVGSLLMAGPSDRKGPRWAVSVTLIWWILVVCVAYFAQTRNVFLVVACLAGLGLGAVQASSRALMSRLIPHGREAELFGFYALCGRTGAILGPVVFAAVTAAFSSQRPAVLCIAAFYVAGYLLLRRVRLNP